MVFKNQFFIVIFLLMLMSSRSINGTKTSITMLGNLEAMAIADVSEIPSVFVNDRFFFLSAINTNSTHAHNNVVVSGLNIILMLEADKMNAVDR